MALRTWLSRREPNSRRFNCPACVVQWTLCRAKRDSRANGSDRNRAGTSSRLFDLFSRVAIAVAAQHRWNLGSCRRSSVLCVAQIQFTGWLTPQELTNWYRRADILVVPSWYEPFGMVILEGMLHGVAIAASAVGGPREILDHERTGLLFPARNSKALAEAILRLVRDPIAVSVSPLLAQERCERNGFGTTLLRR